MARSDAPAAPDRLAPSRSATLPGARQRRRPDAEIVCGGEVSFEPPFTSLEHLVGEDVELRRDGYPESIGGLTIDHQMEFGRLLDRQVAGLCALENLVDERRGATEEIEEVLAIAHQPTSLHVIALWEHGRQTVRTRDFSNTLALLQEDCV